MESRSQALTEASKGRGAPFGSTRTNTRPQLARAAGKSLQTGGMDSPGSSLGKCPRAASCTGTPGPGGGGGQILLTAPEPCQAGAVAGFQVAYGLPDLRVMHNPGRILKIHTCCRDENELVISPSRDHRCGRRGAHAPSPGPPQTVQGFLNLPGLKVPVRRLRARLGRQPQSQLGTREGMRRAGSQPTAADLHHLGPGGLLGWLHLSSAHPVWSLPCRVCVCVHVHTCVQVRVHADMYTCTCECKCAHTCLACTRVCLRAVYSVHASCVRGCARVHSRASVRVHACAHVCCPCACMCVHIRVLHARVELRSCCTFIVAALIP